jgi:predicted nucleic acid-binding protein
MKPYLDNDMVSAVAKSDFPPAEMKILEQLVALFEAQKLELTTSKVTALEIARYEGPKKGAIERVYASLAKVPFVADHKVLGFQSSWNRFGGESYPLVEDDAISSTLRNMRLDRTDAHHLMVAIRAGRDRFITYDKKNLKSEFRNRECVFD